MKQIKLVTILLSLVLTFTAIYNLYAAEVKGKTVNLSSVVLGQEGSVNKEQAIELVKAGKPLAFKSNSGELFLVFNTDGSVADKNLALNADAEYTITGKVQNKNGFKYIIADKFN